MWDISEIVTGITWKTTRFGKPGSLDFTLIKKGIYQNVAFQYNNGDIIRFRKDNQNVFYGYIFSIDGGKNEDVRIKCYDQIRYLMAQDTYVFQNVTVTDIIQQIAEDFNLQVGTLADTVYRIPTMVEDGKKLLDMIDKGIVLTEYNTTLNYILFDDFGALSLLNSEDILVPFIIGDGSLMYDYNMKTAIDQDTYNKIKLYKDNKDTGKREIYASQDSANMARWGTLQLYQSVDENLNAAQINQMLEQLMTLKNRESKTLKLNAIGDSRVRAGAYVPIIIEEYGINQPFLVDQCTHSFNGSDHTMNLELKVIE